MSEMRCVMQVGCGVGNAIFPLLECSPGLFVWGLDFARTAISLARQHPAYAATQRCVDVCMLIIYNFIC